MMELQENLGLTYIFISHDLSVVKHISDNIGVMYLGQIIEKASKRHMFEHPLHPYTIALLSAIPSINVKVKKKKIILKGEITSPINPKPGCRFSMRCPFVIAQCLQEDPQLVEVEKGHFVACFRYNEIKNGTLQFETK
jgi:peptide/nickel transport system ATP-binding protein